MNDMSVPCGFLPFSEAIRRLEEGMWGGLPQPDAVRKIKRTFKKASIGFGRWREKAGQRLTAAVRRGELVVYVLPKPRAPFTNRSLARRSPEKIEPVPVSVLRRLIAPRKSLPDHPIRPSIKTAGGNEKLFAFLTSGLLVVRANDFDAWYQSERAKRKWPSQKHSQRSGIGRPTTQSDAVRNPVIGLVRDGKWTAKDGIAMLRRLLVEASSASEVPSPDTLERLVDQLHCETGESEFFRPKRSRRKWM
jgi:hypothetical protein